MNKEIRTRIAPSPTGRMHIGTVRAALFNYLYAKQKQGQMVVRIEDTDAARDREEYVPDLINQFRDLGFEFEGPYRQSERGEIYKEHLQIMLENGTAYEAEDSEHVEGAKVIRLKNPNKVVTFNDMVRGEISIDSTDFGDFVLARSIDNALYHFAVVVDDADMNISHVIRGEDHITSTPRQILIYEALGKEIPVFGHMPMMLGEDGKKLSKRHGAVSVAEFLEQGYLKEAILNYLAFQGWNPGGEREIYSVEELVDVFDMLRVKPSPAQFNYDKLDDINRHYMLELSEDEYKSKTEVFLSESLRDKFGEHPDLASRFVESVLRDRVDKFSDIQSMEEAGEMNYLFEAPLIDQELMSFKEESFDDAKRLLTQVVKKLSALDDWKPESIKETLWDWSGEVGRGSVLHPMRTVLTGRAQSPDPFTVAYVLGKDETIKRLTLV